MRTASPLPAHGVFKTLEDFFLSRCCISTAQSVAVGGLEKAVSRTSSHPLAKTATGIPAHSHKSDPQTHSKGTPIAERREGAHAKSRRQPGNRTLQGDRGFAHSLDAQHTRSNRAACPHATKSIPRVARHRGAGAMLIAAEDTAHPTLRKTSTAPEPPSHARSCHPQQLRRCHLLRASLWLRSHIYIPPTQTPQPSFTGCCFLCSWLTMESRIPVCHP